MCLYHSISVSLSIYIYTYVYIYIYIFAYTHRRIYIYTYLSLYIYIFVLLVAIAYCVLAIHYLLEAAYAAAQTFFNLPDEKKQESNLNLGYGPGGFTPQGVP